MKLYHRVPKILKYDSLMPLNKLEHIEKALFDENNWKYLHRLELKKKVIPYLNCLWNDVIHMTPVHPSQIKSALESRGLYYDSRTKWFEICPETCGLTSENSVIFHYSSTISSCIDANDEEFTRFAPHKLQGLGELRQEVLDYYAACKTSNQHPMTFHKVPHVQFKGELPITTLKVIEV
ncbi:hypothetical protein L4C36_15205 [Photobacterium japonica]|uniref:hypothetical protein n=1 Tax=Photobacterium japonica TaxID=2910235 RepID=UPI003D15175D